MKTRRSVHVVHILHSFGTGGMEKGIVTVINHAAPEFKHTIICLKKSGASQELLNKPVKIIEMNKKEGNSLFFIFQLMKTLKQLKADVVHTRNWGGMDGIIAARLAGISNIIHGEHGWSMDDPNGLNRKRFWVRRFMDLWITKYTCVSDQMKNWLENNIKVKKSVIQLYNGVECDTVYSCKNTSIKKQLGIPLRAVVIGIVARLDPIKNHSGLIKAFHSLRSGYPNSYLLIIGDGPERNKLERQSGGGILFLGNRSDVKNLLGVLDIFVLPSFNEGISNTILEAMSAGLPVVASKRGGNPELVKNNCNGFLFEPDDIPTLEALLLKYISDAKLREKHGKNGRRKAEKLFSIGQMVLGNERVWKNIVSVD